MLFVKPYYEYGDRRRWRLHTKAAVLLLALLSMVVVLQFAYPRTRALPFTKLGSHYVGLKDKSAIAAQSRQIVADRSVLITAGSKNYQTTFAELGVGADGEQTAKLATSYSWKARLVPFSALWLPPLQDYDYIPNYDEAKLMAFAQKIHADLASDPVNAAVVIQDGLAKVLAAKDGYNFTTDEIYAQLKVADIDKTVMTVQGDQKHAAITTAAAQDAAEQMNQLLKTGYSLMADGKMITVPAEELAKWLVTVPNGSKLDIGYNKEAITQYVDQLNVSMFTVVAPQLASSTGKAAPAAKMIDASKTTDIIYAELAAGKVSSTVTLMDIPTITIDGKKYLKTQGGLTDLLKDLAASHKGSIAIKVQEQAGRKWQAGYDSAKQFTPASTYKLFVTYLTFKNVQDGKWKLTDKTSTGNTIQGCIEKAIVNSDNACAEALLAKLGGNTAVTKSIKAAGYTNSSFSPMRSTADDQTLLLGRLFNGELLNKENTDMMLGFMKRQVYRQGVPKGTGLVVADKVGFLDGLLHDSAIVYAEGRPYTLVIYTDQSSWSDIADMAAKIDQFLK